jgi:hypothetical protein
MWGRTGIPSKMYQVLYPALADMSHACRTSATSWASWSCGQAIMRTSSSEGVSELWICYPRTDEATPQSE